MVHEGFPETRCCHKDKFPVTDEERVRTTSGKQLAPEPGFLGMFNYLKCKWTPRERERAALWVQHQSISWVPAKAQRNEQADRQRVVLRKIWGTSCRRNFKPCDLQIGGEVAYWRTVLTRCPREEFLLRHWPYQRRASMRLSTCFSVFESML